jgi:hypothetical protein
MSPSTSLSCRCGQVRIELTGQPMLSADCCCDSCRKAAAQLEELPGAAPLGGPHGETPFVLYRKDRIGLPEGRGNLRVFRLSPAATTRRIVAACCNTPLFMEFTGGHWLSLYGTLWPEGARPAPDLRTMTRDLSDPAALPDDVPNHKTQPLWFFGRLLGAWIGMGFRSPEIDVEGELYART